MFAGTMIDELIESVERAEFLARTSAGARGNTYALPGPPVFEMNWQEMDLRELIEVA